MAEGSIEGGLQHLISSLQAGRFTPVAPSSSVGSTARQCELEPASVSYVRRSAGWNDVSVRYSITLRRSGEVSFEVMKELIGEANGLYGVVQASKNATYEVSGDASYDWDYEAGTALTMAVNITHNQRSGT